MSKVMLVLDEMPKDCWECPLYYDTLVCILCENDYHEMAADDPCPLRPMPKKRQPEIHGENSITIDTLAGGWNACIDEITGGDE